MNLPKHAVGVLVLFSTGWMLPPTLAQTITPALDGTGTKITQTGNEYLINGGTRSGSNLFHSFAQFDLNRGNIANFVGTPALQNILGRVTGGDASLINGLLQVSNSNANLYLMNPAGFVFGSDAQLDVAGSFTATTATRLGFGEKFLHGFGINNYAALTGDPTSFIFDHATGMIFNQGDLAVPDHQSLWLVGSSVLNLGTISGGNISIVAMPEQRQIKVNGAGSLLSLALDAVPLGSQNLSAHLPANIPANIHLFQPTDLPKYLTGSETETEQKLVAATVTGDVGIAGLVQGDNVQLLAASRVSGDLDAIQAGEEGIGGLTVGRFRASLEDSLGYTFIDQRVDNAEQLLFGGQAGTIATIVLQKEAGLTAVTQALLEFAATGQKLDAINIVAEGNQGYFWLGNNLVNGATVEAYQAQLQQWRSALGDGADLLLYSCFTALGMNGEALIQQLADITGADIAASIDITGSEHLGGNWQLESKTGVIEANNPFALATIATWAGKLAVITVTSVADEDPGLSASVNGQMTLREALAAANNNSTYEGQTGSGVDEIIFDTSGVFATPQTITTSLSLGEFVISSDLKITGTGRNNLSIDGNGSNRVFNINNSNVTIEGLTIQNGDSSDGGGIYNNYGNLIIQDSTISNNYASGRGGGVYNYSGIVTIQNSTISNNYAGNYGGGINNSSGTVTVTRSKISGNSTRINGGGLANSNFLDPGSMTILDSTISQNSALSEFGGGIWNNTGNVLTVDRSTLSGNFSAQDGGGIYSRGTATITNSTFSQNQTYDRGGGLANRASLTITNSTFSENSAIDGGAGIYNRSGSLTLANTIIANSLITEDYLAGTESSLVLLGNNLVEDGSITGASVINSDPLLAPLDNYGGLTETHFLLPGSVALDAGDDAVVSGSLDQRGGDRLINRVDLGAIEFQGAKIAILSGDGQSAAIGSTFAAPVVAKATEELFSNVLSGLNVSLVSVSSGGGAGLLGSPVTGVTDATGEVDLTLTANNVGGIFEFVTSVFIGGVEAGTARGLLANTVPSVPPAPLVPLVPPVAPVPLVPSPPRVPPDPPVLPPISPEPPVPSVPPEPPVDTPVDPPADPSADTVSLETCEPNCGEAIENNNILEQQEQRLEVDDIQETIKKITERTGTQIAVIYALFAESEAVEAGGNLGETELITKSIDDNQGVTQWEFKGDRLTDFLNSATKHFLDPADNVSDDAQLQLVVITSTGKVIRRDVPGATRRKVFEQANLFMRGVTRPQFGNSYLAPAQSLYDVFVRPIQDILEQEEIDNLTYIMDDKLRILPLAAMHDGEQFIVQNYSIGLMPSFSLTNTSDYVLPSSNAILAMGTDNFTDNNPLPAAPLEVEIVAEQIWQNGEALIGNQFTIENLVAERQRNNFGILHLATHGNFDEGNIENSYIQFANEKVTLDQLDRLQLGKPPLELLVLSACRTAFGDAQSELGFAGLALNSGAKSAIGSMWYVDDSGTLSLMTSFYEALANTPIKAEALQQAQLALLNNQVRLEGSQLISGDIAISLPEDVIFSLQNVDLSHPYYWSAFALVGNPW